ncbi:MAG: serine/threonine-protein phosphatase, partial [Clostridiales bacterium]|nr:serine/threonine-protein phosphatase [Clostridiales bacterium]
MRAACTWTAGGSFGSAPDGGFGSPGHGDCGRLRQGHPGLALHDGVKNPDQEPADDGAFPAEALSSVNLQLCDRNEAQMFVTVWAAVLELSTGKGLACNAGHEHPILRQTRGPFEPVINRHNM